MHTKRTDRQAYASMTWQALSHWLARHRGEVEGGAGSLSAVRAGVIRAELRRREKARRIWK